MSPQHLEAPSAARLADALVAGPGSKQDALLYSYQHDTGSQYTEALALAIPRLKGQTKEQARDVLAERLTRMTAKTLRAYLANDDRELRSAAALAAGG